MTNEDTPYGNPVIDFDEAQRAWRANKRNPRAKSIFEYCCGAEKPNGEFCKAPPHCWKNTVRKFDPEDDGVKRWSYCTRHTYLKCENSSDKQTEN